jgi:hypothetical protein
MKIALVVAIVLVAIGSAWLAVRNYYECRTQFSVIYCLTRREREAAC